MNFDHVYLSLTPNAGSPVGALSPFDSRSDVSASSHVPVVPSSPQISERGSRELFTASAIPYEGLLTPALSDFDPAVKAASVVPEIGGSPRQTPSPTPSEPSSIDAAQDVSPRDTTPIPDDPASHALTEAAVEEHDVRHLLCIHFAMTDSIFRTSCPRLQSRSRSPPKSHPS